VGQVTPAAHPRVERPRTPSRRNPPPKKPNPPKSDDGGALTLTKKLPVLGQKRGQLAAGECVLGRRINDLILCCHGGGLRELRK
jgi:hypothetical protein